MQDSIEYLGHVVDKQGIHPNPKKVDAILQAKTPKDQKELRAFLGLLTYYRKFISKHEFKCFKSAAPFTFCDKKYWFLEKRDCPWECMS